MLTAYSGNNSTEEEELHVQMPNTVEEPEPTTCRSSQNPAPDNGLEWLFSCGQGVALTKDRWSGVLVLTGLG